MPRVLRHQVKGAELVSDPEKDKTIVASLLELKKQIDVLHANAFMSNEDFKRSIKVPRRCVGERTVSG